MAQQDFDIIPIVDRNLMTKIEGDATDNKDQIIRMYYAKQIESTWHQIR